MGLERNSETCTTIYVYHGGMCSVLAALCVPAHCCKYTDVYLPGAACSQCHTPPMLYVCCAGPAMSAARLAAPAWCPGSMWRDSKPL